MPFVTFIKNYLVERTGEVSVKDVFGRQFLVRSRVPQDSVLGPFLFNIFMGNLNYEFSNTFTIDNYLIILYADDITIVERVEFFANHMSSVSFILNWFAKYDFKCNIAKCGQSFYSKSTTFSLFVNDYQTILLPLNLNTWVSFFQVFQTYVDAYVDLLINRASNSIYIIPSLKLNGISITQLLTVYYSLIL